MKENKTRFDIIGYSRNLASQATGIPNPCNEEYGSEQEFINALHSENAVREAA
jgi:hypothetical protein